jgi:hypothetical protein
VLLAFDFCHAILRRILLTCSRRDSRVPTRFFTRMRR